MKELEHILRAEPAWRRVSQRTECGLLVAKTERVLSRADAVAKLKRLGQERFAMTTCMTCTSRAHYGRSLAEDWAHRPTAIIARECVGSGFDGDSLLHRELRAITALIEAHRDEFDGYLAGLAEAVSLNEWKGKRHVHH